MEFQREKKDSIQTLFDNLFGDEEVMKNISETVYLADGAKVIGDVTIGKIAVSGLMQLSVEIPIQLKLEKTQMYKIMQCYIPATVMD